MIKSICIFTIASILVGHGVHAADLSEGFSGLSWGTDLSTIENLSELSRKENVGYYFRFNEIGLVYNTYVDRVVYGFYQNKFFAVYFRIKSRKDFDKIKESMTSDYGLPRAQLRVNRTIYIWEHKNINMKMKFYKKAGNHKLAYYYTPLSRKLNESRLEKNFEQFIKLVPKK